MKPQRILKLEEQLGFDLFDSPPEHIPKIPSNSYCLDENNNIIALSLSTNFTDYSFFAEGKDEGIRSEKSINNFDFIKDLTQLTALRLIGNKIKDISFLKDFAQLTFLELTNNRIVNISPLVDLKKLEYLDLMKNRIADISALKSLTQLQTLNLNDNAISDISALENLTLVRVLLLRHNRISKVPNTIEFVKLEHLELYDNLLTSVEFLKNATALISLDLRKNDISDITYLLKLDSLKSVELEDNKKIATDFPASVLDAGWESLKQFAENSKSNVTFKNVKVLLLGNPNIGKSNLLEYFETGKAPVTDNSTHGVRYKQLTLNGIDFHFWDFGGQEYFHATHQIFFSHNAINLVLWGKDTHREGLSGTCFGIDYWLRIITQLNGDNTEITLLTENKTDLNEPRFSENRIPSTVYDKFKTLTIYESHISLTQLRNLEGFKEKFFLIAEDIINEFRYPQFWEVFWKRINSLDKDYATIVEINNRPHENNVIPAAKVFHNMGMLLYFSEIIPGKIFHKPQVLLDLLYNKVLGPERKSKITENEIITALDGNSLDLTSDEVLALLKYFNLVFELDREKDAYFIPQYLMSQSKAQEVHEELGFSIINVRISADHYLMSLAMLKVFSKYGNYVDLEKNECLFWRNGIIILKDEQHLLIKYVAEKQSIGLYASNKNNNKSLQKEVVDFILDLPEDATLPKRNLDNHRKKRWVDVLDENDVDFAPHFSERINEYPEYKEEFETRHWERGYRWASDFFNVEVSIDGESFIDWTILKTNAELPEINFVNAKGEQKLFKATAYWHLIDKKIIMEEKKKQATTVNYNFNAPVSANNIGGENNIVAQTDNGRDNNKPSPSKGLSSEERRLIERWKLKSVLWLVLYALASAYLTYAYIVETEFIMQKDDWSNFKQGTISTIAITIWGALGVYMVYKAIYERYFDPSKENAFIDLHRKKK